MRNDGFVLDTNVLISAALSTSAPPARVTLWVIENARLIFSPATFDELRTRIWRPKFDRYLNIERRNAIIRDFSAIADWVEIDPRRATVASRDRDDDMFIHTALAGSARWLVSGDRDLLEIGAVENVNIVTSADMLSRIMAIS